MDPLPARHPVEQTPHTKSPAPDRLLQDEPPARASAPNLETDLRHVLKRQIPQSPSTKLLASRQAVDAIDQDTIWARLNVSSVRS